jgi:glutathione S-transferase
VPTPTLIYFEVRGRAEFIRLILAEAGVEYAEHPIDEGTPPKNGRPTDFDALKATGLLAFDAVPVWEEPDGFRLAQSVAIANYLARKHGLMPKDDRGIAQVEQAIHGFEDARADIRKVALKTMTREELEKESIPRWLNAFEKLLEANGGGFLVGSSITSADLALWYLVELYEVNGFGETVARYPRVKAHFDRIGKRPKLAAYVASSKRFPPTPLPK